METCRIIIVILCWTVFCPFVYANNQQISNYEINNHDLNQIGYTGRWKVGYHVNEFNEPNKDKPFIYINSISGEKGKIIIDKSGRMTLNSDRSIRVWKILIKNDKTNTVYEVPFLFEDEDMSGWGNNNFFIKSNAINNMINLLNNGERIIISMSNDEKNYLFEFGNTKYLKNAIRLYLNNRQYIE